MRISFLLRVPAMLGVLALTTISCHKDEDEPVAVPSGPQTVTINQPGLYPEGMQFDSLGRRYFVSSLMRGTIGQVTDDGTYAPFADDPQLISTDGLQLDLGRNRLLTTVGDLGVSRRTSPATTGQLAALASFDARTGARTAYVNLGALRPGQGHFANDIAVDAQGNAYVTDSFSPIIYKVTVQGQASVFFEDNSLAAPAGGFGFNGIVFHPAGYLLVNHTSLGKLFKLPVGGTGTPTATVVATSQSLAGADGMRLQDAKTLLVVANIQGKVLRLASGDNFASAGVTGTFATGPNYPTSLTRRGPDVYVLYAHLDQIGGGQAVTQQFTINKVVF